jgi:hypothetical protein
MTVTAIELRMLFLAGLILVTVTSVVAAVALFGITRWIGGTSAGDVPRRLRDREAA